MTNSDRIVKIATEAGYTATMKEINALMKKGEANLSESESKKLRTMAVAAEEYEEAYVSLPKPKDIAGMIELKMYQLNLNQASLAAKLHIGKPKLSQILNGKRPPDVAFLKAAYKELQIDPAFLLEKA